AGRGRGCARSTTQIATALPLSWCTDVRPGPTHYPKHGSHGGPPPPAAPRSATLRVPCFSSARVVASSHALDHLSPKPADRGMTASDDGVRIVDVRSAAGWRGARGGARETRVSGTASDPARNRCTLTGATHCRFAWECE